MRKFLVISLIVCVLMYSASAYARTAVMLRLDKTPIIDECGNSWTSEGACAISDVNPKTSTVSPRDALQFDGESYLQMDNGIILGGKDFTIDGWAYVDSTCGNFARIFEFNVADLSEANRVLLCRVNSGVNLYVNAGRIISVDGLIDELFHFACVYEHEKGTVSLYINGELKESLEIKLQPRKYARAYLGKSAYSDPLFIGYIYSFRVTDDEALWKENFTPPAQVIISKVNQGDNNNNMMCPCPCCRYFMENYIKK